METFGLSRDVFKTLTTKQFYTKRNAEILQNPYIHAKAIYEGFKTQKVSRIVEEILQIRYKRLQKDQPDYVLTK